MDIQTVQELRNKTGAGVVDCQKALVESGGDLAKAVEILRKKGQKIAASKMDRVAKEGLIGAYVHGTGKVGAMVEIDCESDFVAKNDEFKELLHDVAMQVAATNPPYLKPEDIPAEIIAKEREIYLEQLKKEGKPESIAEKILEGKLQKYYQEVCLLKQPFIKDDKMTIEDLVKSKVAKIGENIQIKRFIRFSL